MANRTAHHRCCSCRESDRKLDLTRLTNCVFGPLLPLTKRRGPVFDPAGTRVGKFNSVWRRAPDGNWRIVFDIGCPECDCTPKPAAVPAGATEIAALAWMAGDWQTPASARQVDEHWTAPGGVSMLGMSRTVANGATQEFEYLRIVEREDGVFYVAHPGGRSPGTEFRLTRSAEGEAVFENPQHDFPKRITYRRGADGTLTAVVDGGEGTKGITVAYRAMSP